MLIYEKPIFDFSAPTNLAKRKENNEIPNQPYRSVFMRDRDRVMYSSAFRRLAGKTQIYLTGKDDHRRNRLTHTLEVSQIARTVSQALNLDCDLTEAIALAHDLGHTPFGHAGEQTLHEIMVPNSSISIKDSPMRDTKLMSSPVIEEPLFGFKHNVQGLRVAASLENNYGNAGLNLTNFTLWGILHHSSLDYKPQKVKTTYLRTKYREQYKDDIAFDGIANSEAWSFEAFVVAQADEIAQWHHDLEDALRGHAMTNADVCTAIKEHLSHIMTDDDNTRLAALSDRKGIDRKYVTDLSRIVVNTLVNRLIECSLHNLGVLWGEGIDKNTFFVEHSASEENIKNAIAFTKFDEVDEKMERFKKEYPSIISKKIHHSRDVERMNAKGQYIIKKLFQAYYSHPQQLPDNVIVRYMVDMGCYPNLDAANEVGTGSVRIKFEEFFSDASLFAKIALMRKICDHIAGMTDHFAMEEYNNLYG